MGYLINAIIATVIVTIIGGGAGYLIWLKTRPKKQAWRAKVYQLSEGIREEDIKDNDGNVITSLKLKELKPYHKDVVERIVKEHGMVVFRLQKLNKVIDCVNESDVEYWGEGKSEVSVLIDKGSCTLLKKGYDFERGQIIYNPLPHSRINVIKSEISIRKERIQKEKDILQAITPWIVTGVCVLGLIAIAYVLINGFVEVSENVNEGVLTIQEMQDDLLAQQIKIEQIRSGTTTITPNLGRQSAQIVPTGNNS